MNVSFVFGLKNSLGGAERRFTRVYNEICSENEDIKCDFIGRGCDRNTALKRFQEAECSVINLNKIRVSTSPLKSVLYLLRPSNKTIHFFGMNKFNLLLSLICKLSNKKAFILFVGIEKRIIVFRLNI